MKAPRMLPDLAPFAVRGAAALNVLDVPGAPMARAYDPHPMVSSHPEVGRNVCASCWRRGKYHNAIPSEHCRG